MSMAVHRTRDLYADIRTPDPHQDTYSRTILGFWVYLMTDCILFTTLFATYAVVYNSTFDGPTSHQLFSLPETLAETLFLLFSSVTCGLAVLSSIKGNLKYVVIWLALTFILGAAFLTVELREFSHFVQEGASWQRSAFLSGFFTLVGTHGLHVTVGLCWLLFIAVQISMMGINIMTFRRLVLFSMFWHFLDVIWIFVYTFVYLIGVV